MDQMQQDTPVTAGMDISKLHLDIFLHPLGEVRQFTNTPDGWHRLGKWLKEENAGRVVYEATGKLHKGVERYLDGQSFPLNRLNPMRSRRFAEAIGALAKTDKADARILALFGARLQPDATVLQSSVLEQLKELTAARRALINQRTRNANREKTLASTLLKRQLRQSTKQLNRQIEQIDEECRKLLKADAALLRRLEILESIPAVGEVTAMTLVAEMPELGELNDKQVASLAGVAPVAHDSGASKGKRRIKGGRAQVRQAVYMAALVATRFNHDMKRKYDSMIKAGKLGKVAITAIIRKLLILANALIRDNRIWTEIKPCA